MILRSPLDLRFPDLFFALDGFVNASLYLKLEGFHLTGSIKIKTALFLMDDLEASGRGRPVTTTIVESSSGNLGAALSAICKIRGYRFLCVTDPNVSPANLQAIRAYGGEIVTVTAPDANGGYLQTRLNKVQEIVSRIPGAVWLNQYANPAAMRAHAETTAREILQEFPKLDWLFVGTGTTGTFMGCAQHLRAHSPHTIVAAVEPEGSVTFGGTAGRRHIPGLGTSRVPELADPSFARRVIYIDETTTIRTCREILQRYGLLIGGSTGTVLAGVRAAQDDFKPGDVVVAISPDMGDKYLDTIYDDAWVGKHVGLAARCRS